MKPIKQTFIPWSELHHAHATRVRSQPFAAFTQFTLQFTALITKRPSKASGVTACWLRGCDRAAPSLLRYPQVMFLTLGQEMEVTTGPGWVLLLSARPSTSWEGPESLRPPLCCKTGLYLPPPQHFPLCSASVAHFTDFTLQFGCPEP